MDRLRKRVPWGSARWIIAVAIGTAAATAGALAKEPYPEAPKVRPAAPPKARSVTGQPAAAAAEDPVYTEEKARTNAGTVSIMVSSLNCTCMQFAEDIRNVVNDLRPNGHRALIAIGDGGPQHLKDLNFLLGVHMAIVDEADL
jgi:hypothetical protein